MKNISPRFYRPTISFRMWFVILGGVFGVLVSCNTSPTGPQETTVSETSTVVFTQVSIATIPTLTSTPTPTVNPSATPTPTPSLTLTPLPTETPMPALPSEEAKRRVEELLTDNANCQLPCWWGIVPGKTSWSAAQSFLYQFNQGVYIVSVNHHEPFTHYLLIPVREEVSPTGYLGQYYHIEAGKVQLIEAYAGGRTPFYTLSTVFANYGKPDEIWVWTEPYLLSGYAGVEFAVFYQRLGIIVLYFQLGQQFDTHITVCPPPFSANTLILWDPSIRSDFQSVIKQTNFKAKKYHPLEEVTQVSVDQFFEKLSNPDSKLCFDAPIDIWYK